MERSNLEEKLKEGMNLARNGQFSQAELVFDKVLAANPQDLEALIWKAAVTNDPAVAVACLEKVLRFDPHNHRAKNGLEWARKRLESSSQLRPVTAQGLQSFINEAQTPPVPTTVPDMPLPAKTTTFSPSGQSQTGEKKVKSFSKQILTSNPPQKPQKVETNSEAVPYKKSRLQPSQTKFAAVELPPEALKKPEKTEKDTLSSLLKFSFGNNHKKQTAPDFPESSAFKAAQPKVQISVSDQVVQSLGDDFAFDGRSSRFALPPYLAWLCFGGAILLALLTFFLSNFAPLLGVLAVIAAACGAVLFNQVNTGRK
jgi:hypothetical protein